MRGRLRSASVSACLEFILNPWSPFDGVNFRLHRVPVAPTQGCVSHGHGECPDVGGGITERVAHRNTPSCALMLKFEWPLIVPGDPVVLDDRAGPVISPGTASPAFVRPEIEVPQAIHDFFPAPHPSRFAPSSTFELRCLAAHILAQGNRQSGSPPS